MRLLRAIAAIAAVLTVGCQTAMRRAPAPPRTISIACTAPYAQIEARTKEALAKNGFTLVPDPENGDEIDASRPAVYTGMGEGLQMNGPYRWDSRYRNGVITITVQTVGVNPDGSVYPSQSHDEKSSASDRRYFMPVVQSLQQFCARPGGDE